MTLSYAIVRDDPPEIYLAEDIDTLHWVLALQVVARSRPDELPEPAVGVIRGALLDERWADAVVEWIEATGRPIDVYPSIEVHRPRHVELASAELHFTPLFADGH